jgi:hypothetical protein
VLLSLAFVGAVVAALVRSTMNLAQYRVEVCMDFEGRSSCRTAAGSAEEYALRSATDNACALIATGVTETMACTRSAPRSVRWVKRP